MLFSYMYETGGRDNPWFMKRYCHYTQLCITIGSQAENTLDIQSECGNYEGQEKMK